MKKRQDILNIALLELEHGIDKQILTDEMKTLNDAIWENLNTIKQRESAIEHYDRVIARLEKLKELA